MFIITSSSAQVTPDGEGQPSNTRFKVVKIDQRPGFKFTARGSEDGLLHEHRLFANGQSSITYKRGRWTVIDFYDPPPVIAPATQVSSNAPLNSKSSPLTPPPNSSLTTGPRLADVQDVVQIMDSSTSTSTASIVTLAVLDASRTVIVSPLAQTDCNGHPLAGMTIKSDPVECTSASVTTSSVVSPSLSTSATGAPQISADAAALESSNSANCNNATAAANETVHSQSHHQNTQQSQHQNHHHDHHHTNPHANRKERLETGALCVMENRDISASVSESVAESVTDSGSDEAVSSDATTTVPASGAVRGEGENSSSSSSDSESTTLVTVVKSNHSKSSHAVRDVESTSQSQQQSTSAPVDEAINNVVVNTVNNVVNVVNAPTSDPSSGYATPLSSVPSVVGTCSQSVQSGIASAYVVSAVAIDNKIEQAMDLVKSHLMFAVKEEVDVLKDKIVGLLERIQVLETENGVLRQAQQQQLHQQFQQQQQLQNHPQSLISNCNMHQSTSNAPNGAHQTSLPASMIGQANVHDLASAAASLAPTANVVHPHPSSSSSTSAGPVPLAAAPPSTLETTCKTDSASNISSSVSPADVANAPSL